MIEAASYDHQLRWLHEWTIGLKSDHPDRHMLLSITQSVKDARKCNLDHREDPNVRKP